MDSVLGRKQRIKNSDWIETFDKIEQLITKKELDQLVDKTIQDIKAKTKGKKAAYAWSGGKDSLVLGEICRRAGISSCVHDCKTNRREVVICREHRARK